MNRRSSHRHRRTVQTLFHKTTGAMLFMALIFVVTTGRLDWIMGWVYVTINLVIAASTVVFILSRDPEFARERVGVHRDAETWDKVLSPLSAVGLPLVTWIVAGLDIRFGWSPVFPFWMVALGITGVVCGQALIYWSMAVNRYFSTVVRVQHNRGQRVIMSGPYALIRHPGNLGWLFWTLSTPMMLSSLWAFLPCFAGVILIFIRTGLEDATLQWKLAGYGPYVEQVRWRLIPGLW